MLMKPTNIDHMQTSPRLQYHVPETQIPVGRLEETAHHEIVQFFPALLQLLLCILCQVWLFQQLLKLLHYLQQTSIANSFKQNLEEETILALVTGLEI